MAALDPVDCICPSFDVVITNATYLVYQLILALYLSLALRVLRRSKLVLDSSTGAEALENFSCKVTASV